MGFTVSDRLADFKVFAASTSALPSSMITMLNILFLSPAIIVLTHILILLQ